MQETYFTSQHLEGERGANNYTMESYVHTNVVTKKARITQHTQKPRIAHKTKPIYLHVHVYVCIV